MSNSIITFERAFVKLAGDLAVDGYRSPSGEFRVGMASASVAVGYEKNWIGRVTAQQNKTLEDLTRLGFKGLQVNGAVPGKTGLQPVKTISLDDFRVLIVYASSQGKKNAVALNLASVGTTLYNLFLIAFDNRVMTVQETTKYFSDDFIKNIDWLGEDRDDSEAILDHLRFLGELPYDEN